MTKPYYVIGVQDTPWVLGSYETVAKALAAIRWQDSPTGTWVVARRTGPDTFVGHDVPERKFTVGRGPYTAEAFESFKAEWEA